MSLAQCIVGLLSPLLMHAMLPSKCSKMSSMINPLCISNTSNALCECKNLLGFNCILFFCISWTCKLASLRNHPHSHQWLTDETEAAHKARHFSQQIQLEKTVSLGAGVHFPAGSVSCVACIQLINAQADPYLNRLLRTNGRDRETWPHRNSDSSTMPRSEACPPTKPCL